MPSKAKYQPDLRLALTTHKGSDRLSLETTSIDSICSYKPPGWMLGYPESSGRVGCFMTEVLGRGGEGE